MKKYRLKFIYKLLFVFAILFLYCFINTLNVSALEMSTIDMGGLQTTIDNSTTTTTKQLDGYWSNWGPGYLHWTFSVWKVTGTSTSAVPFARAAYAWGNNFNNDQWICDIGSVSTNNSTFNYMEYSVTCPMNVGSAGVKGIYIRWQDSSNLVSFTAQVNISGRMTFEQAPETTVNIDINRLVTAATGTTNAINNQTTILSGAIGNVENGIQDVEDAVDDVRQSVDDVNDTLNDDSVNNNTGTGFFNNFSANNHGLSGIITAPLRLINALNSSTCTPLQVPLPFVNNNVNLPCMSSIYSNYFPTFLALYRLITTGLIGYWVMIKMFGHVKGLQNPNDDRIEVFDL